MEKVLKASKSKLNLEFYEFINRKLGTRGFILDVNINEPEKSFVLQVLRSSKLVVASEVTYKQLANPKIKKFDIKLTLGEESKNFTKENATFASAALVSYLKFFKDLIDSYSEKPKITMEKSDLAYYKEYFEKRTVKRALS